MSVKPALLFTGRVLLHLAVIMAVYLFYNTGNIHPNNRTSSSIQFVYQQF